MAGSSKLTVPRQARFLPPRCKGAQSRDRDRPGHTHRAVELLSEGNGPHVQNGLGRSFTRLVWATMFHHRASSSPIIAC